MSRLSCYCINCRHTASRDEFYNEVAGIPTFEDICPKCTSDDVDVFVQKASGPTDYSPWDFQDLNGDGMAVKPRWKH